MPRRSPTSTPTSTPTATPSSTRGRGRPAGDAREVAPPGELLELALDVFAEKGFEGTSVRDLCRRLGVSHNLIHQRFGSKENLWFAAVDHGFGRMAGELARAAQAAPDDDLERLRAVVMCFLEVSASSPALVQIMNSEAGRPGPRLDHVFVRYIRPTAEVVSEVMDRLAAAGRVRPIPAGVFHFLVAHGAGAPLSLRALSERFDDGTAPTDATAVRAYAESVTDLLLTGIRI